MRCNERLLIGIPILRLQLVAVLLHKAEDVSPALLYFTSASSLTSFYGNNRESRNVCGWCTRLQEVRDANQDSLESLVVG
jgi:hypothetical protein